MSKDHFFLGALYKLQYATGLLNQGGLLFKQITIRENLIVLCCLDKILGSITVFNILAVFLFLTFADAALYHVIVFENDKTAMFSVFYLYYCCI